MQSGERLALEIAPGQEEKLGIILRLRNSNVLQEEPLEEGRKLLLVEKGRDVP